MKQPNFFLRTLLKAGEMAMLALVSAVFALARALGPERASAVGGAITRTLGPLLPVHRVALANIAAAFPEKLEAER
ncbi:MAG TPA: hypothetical protein PK812_10215, partial [Beijerinckiaceae bacterium]|nr:hypothetical protein [Beijerinckiaceae bacterium]